MERQNEDEIAGKRKKLRKIRNSLENFAKYGRIKLHEMTNNDKKIEKDAKNQRQSQTNRTKRWKPRVAKICPIDTFTLNSLKILIKNDTEEDASESVHMRCSQRLSLYRENNFPT